jgi:ribonuclease HI
MQKFVVYTDGASRSNPGDSAAGYIIFKDNIEVARNAIYIGKQTNNYAEYTAVMNALLWCKENCDNAKSCNIELYSDSQVIIKQLNLEYKVKSEKLFEMNAKVREIVKSFMQVKFANLPRENEHISDVDLMLNRLLDKILVKKSA